MHRSLSRRLGVSLYIALNLSGGLCAADFGFSVIIRAGRQNGTWEIGIGQRGSAPSSTVSLNPYYLNNTPQRFEIGYTQSTNTAFVRLYRSNGTYQQASYNPVGGVPLGPGGTWTLPADSFFVLAASRPAATSVTVTGMALSPGLAILQGVSNTTTLTAAQPGRPPSNPDVVTNLPSPIQFMAQGSGGNWLLSGTISFVGLAAYRPSGAGPDDLQFGVDAGAADVPETSTSLSLGCGLGLIGIYALRKRTR
jgi:hypothetical protein